MNPPSHFDKILPAHVHTHNIIIYTFVNLQRQHNSDGDADSTYWEPADNINELYKQLSSKKYREIVPNQLKLALQTMIFFVIQLMTQSRLN